MKYLTYLPKDMSMPIHPAKWLLVPAFSFALTIALAACVEYEEDVVREVSDPAAISVHFTIEKSRTFNPSSVGSSASAHLMDSKGYLQIKGGGVSLNGLPLEATGFVSVGEPHYFSSQHFTYKPDSLYTFTVTLSDGRKFSTSVRTLPGEMISTSARRVNDTAALAWQGTVSDTVDLFYAFTNPTLTTASVSGHRVLLPGDTAAWIPMEGRAGFAYINFRAADSAAVHPAFRGGSATAAVSVYAYGVTFVSP